ncbi:MULTISPECIES: hypothetical protein [Sphingobacterium]|uniref:Uncharacterized protein n=1 Tax=Sphingobacterium ginsenosidimutans TaxID=687845 RepID=A0ABP8A907_9SPHI|nr:hypothetical protein [Sphingobacterium sp. E70]ULT25610.1 hypothetical protein KUH03_00945 [Sphingobacterium sp. E70]
MQKPYYNLDFGATMCKLQIKVNDLEVFMLNIDGQVASEIPLNGGIFGSGEQHIEIRALPLEGEKLLNPQANFHYQVKAVDVNTPNWDFIKSFGKHQIGPEPEPKPFLLSKGVFHADVPYVVSNWGDLGNVNEDDLKERLFRIYREIIDAGKKGDYNKLFAAIELTERRNALTLYLSEVEVKSRVDAIRKDIKEGFKMMDLDKHSVVEVAGNGRLCRLVRIDGNSALALENNETAEELIIELWLSQDKNNNLTVF